jgi:hypothetical protein
MTAHTGGAKVDHVCASCRTHSLVSIILASVVLLVDLIHANNNVNSTVSSSPNKQTPERLFVTIVIACFDPI